jgi:tRNA(fMet)-specific endonuclease VapC
MTWLLDSNACIRYLNRRAPSLLSKLDSVAQSRVFVCSVVKAEIYCGCMRSRDPLQALAKHRYFLDRFVSLPFDDISADIYAEIRTDLTKRGQLIGLSDMMIASICLANDVTLVTHNTAEFGRINGLRIEDWEI